MRKTVAFICTFAAVLSCIFPCIKVKAKASVNASQLIDSIFADEVSAAGVQNVQSLIDTAFAKGAGETSEWFVFSLIQYKGSAYNYSKYISALKKYVESHDSYNSTTAEKYALLFAACGTEKEFISNVLNNEVEGLGIMSRVFGLHLMNNGYSSSAVTSSQVIARILSDQHEDGGWGLSTASDVDVTAMVVQCLAQHKAKQNVKTAINSALGFLSARQGDDGSFTSYGVKNPESAAQVVVALTSLGINPLEDERFIKNGVSAVESMLSFKATDRGYTHKAGGDYNPTATSQVLYALVSIYRFEHGMGPLYKLYASAPEATTTAVQTTKPTTAKTTQSGASATRTVKATTAKLAGQAADVANTRVPSATKSAQRHIYGRTTTARATSPAKKPVTPSKPDANNSTILTSVVPYSATAGTTGEYSATQKNFAAPFTQAQSNEQAENQVSNKIPLKKAAIACVWVLALLSSFFLFVCLKRRKVSDYIVIAAIASAVTLALSLSSIQRADEYYKADDLTVNNTITVTMSIDCSTVAGKGDEKITPADGVILAPTQFTLEAGSTAYDCLVAAAKKYKIQIDDSSAALSDHSNAYIKGINYLYEFDYGELSGWMFSVNGSFGDVGCGSQVLSDSDVIEWQYTVNLGEDLK